jgi:hypothetical protein
LSETSHRIVIELLDQQFGHLFESLRVLARSTGEELLYKQVASLSVGENILRSAGLGEQTFGGITASLWDDPFEWTLPETLSTPTHVLEYLDEVEAVKTRAFSSFVDDEILLKYIALPSGGSSRLFDVLLATLLRATDYRGQAVATLKILSGENANGFIISK